MALTLPNVKLVVLLREPVSRAKSGWSMALTQHHAKERRTLNHALAAELETVRRCLEVTVKEKKWPRVACLWAKFYPTWAHPAGLQGETS